ncbi:uncharacterized protein LOC139913444 [Centroberyx gerrardi]|uniref:uncharacterized protein n=1 Tax=Centroberyx gerrardi TaxID=166262 RepID=UPI003AACC43B
MKAKALSVTECAWTSEECHLVDEMKVATQRDSLCLPNLFRSKKVKPFTRTRTGPTYQVHNTARELLLEVLDRGAVQELAKRAAAASRSSYSQSREQSAELSEEQYAEALTWFSIVLQSGLSTGVDCVSDSELSLYLDRWQGVLKRSSFQTNLLSLSRVEDGDKMEALSAFCSHLTRRCQALYTPGQHLAVKKYLLSYQQAPCPLHLALLCDVSSGFICNMYLYCPEQLQRRSRTPVVEQVVGQLLRPYYSRGHLVQLDKSAWMEGRLTETFSDLGVNIHFAASVKTPVMEEASSSSPPVMPHQHQWTPEDPLSQLVAHLQGWTGPALFPQSDLKGPAVDVFLPGLWAALHMICINTFVLHSLQSQDSGRQICLTEFTRSLASQLAVDNSVAVPVLSGPHTSSYQETYITNLSEQSRGEAMQTEEPGCSSAVRLQGCRQPGVCGLENSGNSCYLNAVLQCLCSTVPLVEYLLNQGTRKELARRKCRVAEVFVRLLEEMWLGQSSSCAPVEARSAVCSIHPQFNNQSQQDAQELLLFLLNALHDDLKKGERRQMCSSTRESRRDQNRNPPTAAGEPTIVSHLFEGQLSYMTLCMHCNHQAHSKQIFTMLSLPIPTDIIKCSLQDCLSLFFQQSILTGGEQMLCSACGVRRDTTVLTSLDEPPEILMLHLKRFGCKGMNKVKLRTNVLFSMENLDLNPFLSSPSAQHTSYCLYAVVNHTGHLDMGHYTALCHNALTHSWHCFDDSVVKEVQDGSVQSPNAYMLLYSRKPFHQPKIHRL